jgi:ribonuclease G
MSKEIYISSTPHETRLAIVEKDELTEIYYERENEYTLAGSIYNGKVTRVLPGMQSSFVDIGLERDAFLYITDFMEEAGDAADFEAAEGGSRAPRREAKSEPRPEGSREGSGKEGGRGDRDRGRGRRDERPREPQAEVSAPVIDDAFDAAPGGVEGEEPGEGAPGADGTRRWRGRRGRRRGRGEGRVEGQPLAETSDSVDFVAAPAEVEETVGPESFESRPRGGREPRREGGRDRNRGREGRGGREDRGPREDRAPREDRGARLEQVRDRFAPRTARFSAAEDDSVDLRAGAEPLILPGESLSKYKPESERAPVAAPLPTAQSLVASPAADLILTGWDGGAVLPGETIRPRNTASQPRSESRGEGRSESRGESRNEGRGSERRRDRDARRGGRPERDGRQTFAPTPVMDPAEAVLPAVTSQHDVEAPLQPFTDDAPAFEVRETEERLEAGHQAHAEEVFQPEPEAIYESETGPQIEEVSEVRAEEVYEAQTDAVPVEAVSEPALEAAEETHELVEEFHETTTEYEPEEDASVSFRVDPVGAREFRQSPVMEEESPAVDEEAAAPEHNFTTVQATGEMISEPEPVEAVPHETATAPIEHETVVQSVSLAAAEATPFPVEAAPRLESAADSKLFAPGDGQLEEELMDDEETDLPQVYPAGSADDLEEEILENAADLGSMLRDMSIDEITRPEPVELDEDDFDIDEEMEEDELEAAEGDEFDGEEELSGSDISEAEEGEYAASSNFDGIEEEGSGEAAVAGTEPAPREGGRRGRRDGRRGGRDRERSGGERSAERSGGDRGRDPRRSGSGDRGRGGRSGGGRHSMQTTDLPAISDLLKPGQEVLVQIAKEPIAKKGARITSHIALPGRFLVFMPTVNHTGVSRKIESDAERRRLKEILLSEKGDASGGFIVRTAASGASEEELRSDLRFLLNLWADIKTRSESSKSPALIYHDLNLVERILRDQVTDNFSAIWVDTEDAYERVLRFLQRFQPALIRRVKLYSKDTPLFDQFGITEQINNALRAKVWLKSGGSIVINQTEALVAIDINTGKYVGKTARLEDTILKTNLDSIPEIVRQMRLRDLGGIIIIDFIDMDERKNRNKVMAALEEELKKDRAPSKVLQFNDFGLVAITRKRVKQSLERTLSTTCMTCTGTGMVKSPVTVCNEIYIELRKMHKVLDKDIMLRVHPEVVKHLKLNGGKWLQEMEELSGKTILVKSDPALHPELYDIH